MSGAGNALHLAAEDCNISAAKRRNGVEPHLGSPQNSSLLNCGKSIFTSEHQNVPPPIVWLTLRPSRGLPIQRTTTDKSSNVCDLASRGSGPALPQHPSWQ